MKTKYETQLADLGRKQKNELDAAIRQLQSDFDENLRKINLAHEQETFQLKKEAQEATVNANGNSTQLDSYQKSNSQLRQQLISMA